VLKRVLQAKAFIASNPIIWLPADTFFDYWIQRLHQLRKAQIQVVTKQPSNICSLTVLHTFLFQSVFTTPKVIPAVKNLLKALKYSETVTDFGCFFIKKQNKETLLLSTVSTDDNDLITSCFSFGRRKAALTMPANAPPTDEYPLGPFPSWKAVTQLIADDPNILISQTALITFSNLDSFSSNIQSVVTSLMIQFTNQYWCMLSTDHLKVAEPPQVYSWQDVLHRWSPDGINEIVKYPVFTPHRAHWLGLSNGSHRWTFEARAFMFFPTPEILAKPSKKSDNSTICKFFNAAGYVSEFHKTLAAFHSESDDDINTQSNVQFIECLQRAFGSLLCLPDRQDTIKSSPWQRIGITKGPAFLVNAKAYKIQGITKEIQEKSNLALLASWKETEASLLREQQGLTQQEALAQIAVQKAALKKKSEEKRRKKDLGMKAKNKRAPPKNRHQQRKEREEAEAKQAEESRESTTLVDNGKAEIRQMEEIKLETQLLEWDEETIEEDEEEKPRKSKRLRKK
jgi:hypothetical protein